MKKYYIIAVLVLLVLACSPGAAANKKSFPVLRGPYLGQKAPGMTAELFAPGIIS